MKNYIGYKQTLFLIEDISRIINGHVMFYYFYFISNTDTESFETKITNFVLRWRIYKNTDKYKHCAESGRDSEYFQISSPWRACSEVNTSILYVSIHP